MLSDYEMIEVEVEADLNTLVKSARASGDTALLEAASAAYEATGQGNYRLPTVVAMRLLGAVSKPIDAVLVFRAVEHMGMLQGMED